MNLEKVKVPFSNTLFAITKDKKMQLLYLAALLL